MSNPDRPVQHRAPDEACGQAYQPAHDQAAARLDAFLRCHTAEEYFAVLDVAYSPQVLAVNRLHILRHFSGEIARIDRPVADRAHPGQEGPQQPPRLDPVTRLARYRDALRRSYQTFVTGTALDHRLFAGLARRAPQAFVPVEEITIERVPAAGAAPVPGGRR